MKRKTKAALWVATCLLLAGVLVCAVAIAASGGFEHTLLSSRPIVTNTHTVEDVFTAVRVETFESKICFVISEDDTCKVVCNETEKVHHTVTVEDGVLTVAAKDERKWYDYIGIFFEEPSLVLHLPRQVYASIQASGTTGDVIMDDMQVEGEIAVAINTGDVSLSAVKGGSIRVAVSTGDVVLKTAQAATSLDITTSTGEVHLANTVAASMNVKTSTGDVELVNGDAAAITIQTSTGDVHGVLLSPKVFTTDTSTGSVKVPASSGEETCDVRTSTGDIRFEIQE